MKSRPLCPNSWPRGRGDYFDLAVEEELLDVLSVEGSVEDGMPRTLASWCEREGSDELF
jgi:hypothetical protein